MTWQRIKIALCVGLPILVLLVPREWVPLQGISVLEQRMIAIFLCAMLAWVLEPIPIFATGIGVIVLELLLLSDSAPTVLMSGRVDPVVDPAGAAAFGQPLSHTAIMGTLAQPIIMLFLGGFFLAIAATRYRLDRNLARLLLRPFGSRPHYVMLGLMLITAVFSMFMSNTATTALMLTLLMPVIGLLPEDDPGRVSFALAIPFAANLGGIGTPIGTPPNAIAMKYLTGEMAVSFGGWMLFALPYVVVALLVTWRILLWLHPPTLKILDIRIEERFDQSPRAWIVYLTGAVTIGLWLSGDLTGMNSYVIALLPVAVFTATGIIGVTELRQVNWDVLWLVAGGIALGLGLERTGLSAHVVQAIPFSSLSPCMIIAVAGLLAATLASFMSNTATAALLLPLLAAIGASDPDLSAVGGTKGLIIAAAIACSLGMSLPVSTPPNSLAYASGLFATRHMARAGGLVGLACLLLLAALAWSLKALGYFVVNAAPL